MCLPSQGDLKHETMFYQGGIMNVRGKAMYHAGCLFIAIIEILLTADAARAWEDPTATFTFGTSTNTNIFNKPEEVGDKINDAALKVTLPHTLKKKQTKLNLTLNYKLDWKQEQEKINSSTTSVNAGITHIYSKRLIGMLAYQYSDYESFLSNGINLILLPKLSKTNSVVLNYTYAKRRFPNPALDAVNQTARIDYKIQFDKKTSLTPFFGYEINSVPRSLGSEYKGNTAGLRYDWKMSGKTTFTTSYDLRVRDYMNPSKATLSSVSAADRPGLVTLGWSCTTITATKTTASCTMQNVTRVEKRGQLSFGFKYILQKNADLNIKYIHYKNNADSSDPGSRFGATKAYDTDIISLSVSIKSLKAKKPKKEEKKDEADKDDD